VPRRPGYLNFPDAGVRVYRQSRSMRAASVATLTIRPVQQLPKPLWKRAATAAREEANKSAGQRRTGFFFHSTGTQLKTREIANTIDAGNEQVFAIMSTILTEYEKARAPPATLTMLRSALSFFFASQREHLSRRRCTV
jgi:hypothetical protein